MARELNRQYCEQFLVTQYLLAEHLAWVQNHLMCFIKMVLGLFHMGSAAVPRGVCPAGQRGTHITGTPGALPGRRALPQPWPGAACQNSSVCQCCCLAPAARARWPCTGTALPLRMCPGSAINSPQQSEHSLYAVPTVTTDFSSRAFGFSESCLQVRFYSR